MKLFIWSDTYSIFQAIANTEEEAKKLILKEQNYIETSTYKKDYDDWNDNDFGEECEIYKDFKETINKTLLTQPIIVEIEDINKSFAKIFKHSNL